MDENSRFHESEKTVKRQFEQKVPIKPDVMDEAESEMGHEGELKSKEVQVPQTREKKVGQIRFADARNVSETIDEDQMPELEG